MPVVSGQIDSFKVPTNARDLSTAFYMLSMPETPILNAIKVSGVARNTKREWWDDVRMPTGTTLGAAYTAAAGTITVADASSIRPGFILRIESSLYRATAVNQTTKVVTITIISGDANHANGTKVSFAGIAKKQGNQFEDSDLATEVKRFNMTQIFDDFVEITGTQLAIMREVNNGNLGLQAVDKKLRRLYYLLARTICSDGVRYEASDNTTPNMMGGIDWFISQYGYNPSATTFSADNFDAFLLEMQQTYGRTPTKAYLNPADLSNFSALRASQIVLQREDRTRGEYVDKYISKYGFQVDLITDPTLTTKKIRVFDADQQLSLLPLAGRQFHAYPVAKQGDSEKWGIVGEYTLEFNACDTTGIFSIS